MKRVLAEQVAEKERQKKAEEERRKQEEERENERIRREQAADEARLEARRQEEARKRALLDEENEAAMAKHQEEPGPLPRTGRRLREATQDQGFAHDRGTRSDLFGLPAAQPMQFNASPNSSPLPWEVAQAGAQASSILVPQQSSFRALGPAASPSPPVSDMLQGLMHQQQELYRHQQEALARLQEEADRLRQEKECAKQDLLDMKARQLEEKEKDVKKLQRKLQRQMLLQSGNASGPAPLHSMLPSVASTPMEGMSGRGPPGEPWGGFYSKYETADTPSGGEADAKSTMQWEPGYPTDEELNHLRQERQEPQARRVSAIPSDPHAWPVAPVPWLQPAEAADPVTAEFPNVIASAPEAPEPASVGEASLFEDSWGKPLENTAQLDERLGNTEALVGNLGNDASQLLEGTLVGESKFVQADAHGANLGSTWVGAEPTEQKFRASVSLGKNLTVNAENAGSLAVQAAVPEESPLDAGHPDAEGLGLAHFSLPKGGKIDEGEDPSDPLSLLQGAVNAIREARAEVACATTSSFARSDQMPFSAREAEEAPSESWEGVLRQFGADDALQSPNTMKPTPPKSGRPPRRARQKEPESEIDEMVGVSKARESGGYPAVDDILQPDLLGSSGQPDSLDFLQGLGPSGLGGLGAASSTMGTTSLDGLGTQRPIGKDDFAAFAAATPEDFDAFLSRLRAQTSHEKTQTKPLEAKDSARGRQAGTGVSAKDRAKFGSPTLRAAAGSLLNQPDHRPASGQSQVSGVSGGRPGSGGSAGSLNSAGGVASLRDLRHQRRKPKTAEDAAGGLSVGVAIPDTGPGTSLHATVPASVPREPSALQSLREEHRGSAD